MKSLKSIIPGLALLTFVVSCDNNGDSVGFTAPRSTPTTWQEVGEVILGGGQEGAAEISAFDPATDQLFVVNNSGATAVDVVDLSDPDNPQFVTSIDMTGFGGGVNSVAVKDGMLAIANENNNKQADGNVVIFNTDDLVAEVAVVGTGVLPDMVTFSPDGRWILTANEGEPNDAYTVDPLGSVTFIDIENNFNAFNYSFLPFNGQEASLKEAGVRVFGPGATLAQDLEPEYITVSDDSQTAYVTLQENNALAVVDLTTQTISDILPLGFKSWDSSDLAIDVSNEDGEINPTSNNPIIGMYQPDAIEFFRINGIPYLITANEGDARDYDGFSEEERVADLNLDPSVFPNAATLQLEENLGRLNITTTLGDDDNDGDYEAIYAYGARSFTIWNAWDGSIVFDSGTDTEDRSIAAGSYPDNRSDDKGTEPEGVDVGVIGGRTYAFIGLERADAVLVYDITNPRLPIFKQHLDAGDAPEGILFIDGGDSPNGQPTLVVSSEDDGSVKIYQLR